MADESLTIQALEQVALRTLRQLMEQGTETGKLQAAAEVLARAERDRQLRKTQHPRPSSKARYAI